MDAKELLTQAMADEDISDQVGVGAWEVTTEPIVPSTHSEGEVMVGRSVRMPLATYERIRVLADTRGTSPSRLIRQWIDEGLQRADTGDDQPDPVAELHRTIDAATRALRALEHTNAA